MNRTIYAAATVAAGAVFFSGCGLQNPFGGDDGESSADEDAVVISNHLYSASTTVTVIIPGNNNAISIGNGNTTQRQTTETSEIAFVPDVGGTAGTGTVEEVIQ